MIPSYFKIKILGQMPFADDAVKQRVGCIFGCEISNLVYFGIYFCTFTPSSFKKDYLRKFSVVFHFFLIILFGDLRISRP